MAPDEPDPVVTVPVERRQAPDPRLSSAGS